MVEKAEGMSPADRRNAQRIPVCIQSQVAIIHSDRGVRTSVYQGTVTDLSKGGAQVHVTMTRDNINSLRKDRYFCPIMFENEPELQIGLVGRLVWFHGLDCAQPGLVNCTLGFRFDHGNEESLDRLEQFLDRRSDND